MSDHAALIERLQALAARTAARPKARDGTARLRLVFHAVEAALRSGASRQEVLDELNGDGFNWTLNGFKSALAGFEKSAARRDQVAPGWMWAARGQGCMRSSPWPTSSAVCATSARTGGDGPLLCHVIPALANQLTDSCAARRPQDRQHSPTQELGPSSAHRRTRPVRRPGALARWRCVALPRRTR